MIWLSLRCAGLGGGALTLSETTTTVEQSVLLCAVLVQGGPALSTVVLPVLLCCCPGTEWPCLEYSHLFCVTSVLSWYRVALSWAHSSFQLPPSPQSLSPPLYLSGIQMLIPLNQTRSRIHYRCKTVKINCYQKFFEINRSNGMGHRPTSLLLPFLAPANYAWELQV